MLVRVTLTVSSTSCQQSVLRCVASLSTGQAATCCGSWRVCLQRWPVTAWWPSPSQHHTSHSWVNALKNLSQSSSILCVCGTMRVLWKVLIDVVCAYLDSVWSVVLDSRQLAVAYGRSYYSYWEHRHSLWSVRLGLHSWVIINNFLLQSLFKSSVRCGVWWS